MIAPRLTIPTFRSRYLIMQTRLTGRGRAVKTAGVAGVSRQRPCNFTQKRGSTTMYFLWITNIRRCSSSRIRLRCQRISVRWMLQLTNMVKWVAHKTQRCLFTTTCVTVHLAFALFPTSAHSHPAEHCSSSKPSWCMFRTNSLVSESCQLSWRSSSIIWHRGILVGTKGSRGGCGKIMYAVGYFLEVGNLGIVGTIADMQPSVFSSFLVRHGFSRMTKTHFRSRISR